MLGAIAGIAGSFIGGKMASDGAKSAGRAQAASADRAAETQERLGNRSLDLQEKIYRETVERNQPYRDIGLNAFRQLSGQTQAQRPTGFETSPGYQFRLQEGENALASAASARGMRLSGAALKDAARFGQGMASDEYGAWWNRERGLEGDTFNRLASVAGVGQTATSATDQAGRGYASGATNINSNMGSNIGNALMAGGQARASGYQGSANAWGNALSGAGAIGNYYLTKNAGQSNFGNMGQNPAIMNPLLAARG